ncbi:2-oxo-4-hydroxy-4-carboxy-5-ureidoimidazoline decarboxylase [Streptomyces xanthii]|uniref:2-oxo-4-hydroxy-4-carboxy-5-ureidoimidazoline decarboxylase n=1 Tax=Streptomyces xanthii TaxID=2768069 RepID=A0A7H1BBJ8_9ACTN|nr:2-oxo-4-hydroxy-4-carboxy-5-ureidoimidazoline decarboxylase [Streptomyces xanthii]QNS06103.1 2-oxo-4-hydroxy-4-carboxy-5-ureidoimidazoline decarboxylase [Streptomyces xanthii]
MTTQDTSRLTLTDVNAMTREEFVAALGGIFEHAAWVAEEAHARLPLADAEALHAAMTDVVRAAPAERVLAFLNGHPELAGSEARAGTMTDDSTGEQKSAGLDSLSAAEVEEMTTLNRAYREAHGFPFILAVRGRDKETVLEELRTRTARPTPAEREEALTQITHITHQRLTRLVK